MSRRGLTLIELVIAGVLLAAVAAILYVLLDASSAGGEAAASRAAIEEAGRRALDGMARDLRNADEATLTITPYNGSDRIVFRTPRAVAGGAVQWNEYAQYRWEPDPQGGDVGRVLRTEGAETLAVSAAVLRGGLAVRRSGDVLTVQVRLVSADARGRRIETSLQTSVTLRNSSRP